MRPSAWLPFRSQLVSFQQAYDALGTQCDTPATENLLKAVANGCLVPTAYPGLTFQKMLKPQYQNYTRVPIFVHILNTMIMSTSRSSSTSSRGSTTSGLPSRSSRLRWGS